MGLVLAFSQVGSWSDRAPYGFIRAIKIHPTDPKFGGFSAIELSDDGLQFLAVSDRGTFADGQIVRDAAGDPTSVRFGPLFDLKSPTGETLSGDQTDSEGLAIAADGTIFVSFEVNVRVARYDRMDGAANGLPDNPAFARLPPNGALEALTVDASGTLYAIPEHPAPAAILPVYIFQAGAWQSPRNLPRPDLFRPVAADIGPDGRLYLLERRFHGLRGFSSRLRRFDIAENSFSNGVTLFQSPPGLHDNLEGLSVWRADDGLRASMISDDNFNVVQVTEFVEYRLPD